MQIINKSNVKDEAQPAILNLWNKGDVTFNPTAVRKLKLKPNMRVQFMNDEAAWSFFITDDKDGFDIIPGRSGRDTLVIYSAPLFNMIEKSTRHKKFKIFESRLKSGGAIIYQLIPIKK